MDEVISVTPAAVEVVREALAGQAQSESLALWLEVNGVANGAYSYDLWFGPSAASGAGDSVQAHGGVAFVVPAESIDRVRGAVLDMSERPGEAGLVILNANTPLARMAVPRGELAGPVAQAVREVLDKKVNPFIAGHGGRAALVGVEGATAYIEMSGGCQGCGLALATLSQGIAVAITDAVPEIHEVVDVTDHASGAHPYFEPGRV